VPNRIASTSINPRENRPASVQRACCPCSNKIETVATRSFAYFIGHFRGGSHAVSPLESEHDLTGRSKKRKETLKKLNISIEKTIISIKKLIISIEKLIIFIEKDNIFIEKLNIFIKKPNISVEKLNISIEKGNVFIEKTDFFTTKISKAN